MIAPSSISQRGGGGDDGEGVGGALAQLQVAGIAREARRPPPAAEAPRSVRRAPATSPAPASCRAAGGARRARPRARPCGPSISTTASSAASGTQKSEGWVAMQCSLQPSTACSRFSPPRASQPEPGSRRLQALGEIVEIGAARALQQIAADGRRIAQLRGGAGQQRFRHRREACWRSARHRRGRHCAPARRCARRHPAATRCGQGPAAGSCRPAACGRATPPFIRSSRLVPAAR